MKILFLSSIFPRFTHEKASSFVFGTLLEETAAQGHQVQWATVLPVNQSEPAVAERLAKKGITYIGDFSTHVESRSGIKYFRFFRELWRAIQTGSAPYEPRFRDPTAVANVLKESGSEVAILFWDSWFDVLIPSLRSVGMPVLGYWARPRYASTQVRFREESLKGLVNRARCWMEQQLLSWQERNHLARSKMMSKMSNICELDARYYRNSGLPCEYISNTWPDAFKDRWEKAQSDRQPNEINVLANIGNAAATGNTFGLKFLREHVLPVLEDKFAHIPWRINLCGGGEMRQGNDALRLHSRVTLKGFVDDLDEEMLNSEIFLLLNNAGPYTGGYTRVIYAFSAGKCLIAHKRLSESMPELIHRKNCLLGSTGPEIAALIAEAGENPQLRNQLGLEARRTYETVYRPKAVVTQLAKICEGLIHA